MQKLDTKQKKEPFVEPSISILSLSSHSAVDALILEHLMRPNQINLTLKPGRLVLVGRQLIDSLLLPLDHHLVGVGDEKVDVVLPVHGLEVPPV